MSKVQVDRLHFRDDTVMSVPVQSIHTSTGAVLSSASTIPVDDTIPQSSEGVEVTALATSITPKKVGNTLRVTAQVYVTGSTAFSVAVGAIFKDSGVNALAVGTVYVADANNGGVITLTWQETVASLTAITFKIRIGCNTGTITLNGTGGVRRFGGVYNSSITVQEIQAG